MKNPSRALWTLYLAAALTAFLGCWQYASAQTSPVKMDKDSDVPIAFDWDGLDVNGDPVPVVVAEFVLRTEPPGTPPLPPFRILTTMAPTN